MEQYIKQYDNITNTGLEILMHFNFPIQRAAFVTNFRFNNSAL